VFQSQSPGGLSRLQRRNRVVLYTSVNVNAKDFYRFRVLVFSYVPVLIVEILPAVH